MKNVDEDDTMLEEIRGCVLSEVDTVPRKGVHEVSENSVENDYVESNVEWGVNESYVEQEVDRIMEEANECHVEQEYHIVRSEFVTPPKINSRTGLLSWPETPRSKGKRNFERIPCKEFHDLKEKLKEVALREKEERKEEREKKRLLKQTSQKNQRNNSRPDKRSAEGHP
ncbi:hypothetical protein PR048_013376, partial [Dryococelus australis]